MSDNAEKIRVLDICGESPYIIGKTEAARLIEFVIAKMESLSSPTQEIRLDFAGISGISPSGARVFFFRAIDRCGKNIIQHLIFENVRDDLIPSLESAADDALSNDSNITKGKKFESVELLDNK